MKYIYTFIFSACLFFITNAQTPQGINYQGIARNASGVELSNHSIGIKLEILNGSATGTAVYTETHALTTDANGLFTLTIGLGTTSGNFSAINWAVGGSKWLKVSMDAAGGSSYQLVGTSQLLSVPYALFAGNVTNNGGKQTIVLSDDVTDAQAIAIIASEVGPNTQEIKIVGTTNLTTVNLSMITTAIYIEVANNNALTSVDLSGLTRCDGPIIFENSPNLSTINLAALSKITTEGLTLDNTGITSLNLPAFVKCNGGIYIQNNEDLTSVNLANVTLIRMLNISDNTGLTSISLSGLTKAENFTISDNTALSSLSIGALANTNQFALSGCGLTSLSVPNLVTSGFLGISNNSNLTAISFPLLSSITLGGFSITNNSNLNSVSFPSFSTSSSISLQNNPMLASLTLPVTNVGNVSITNNGLTTLSFPALTTLGTQFWAYGNKLSVNSINSILNKLVNISPILTGKYIQLNFQNPTAAPTGQGVTDRATLSANGNSVTTD